MFWKGFYKAAAESTDGQPGEDPAADMPGEEPNAFDKDRIDAEIDAASGEDVEQLRGEGKRPYASLDIPGVRQVNPII